MSSLLFGAAAEDNWHVRQERTRDAGQEFDRLLLHGDDRIQLVILVLLNQQRLGFGRAFLPNNVESRFSI